MLFIPSSILPKLHETGRAASESLWWLMTANSWGNQPFRSDAAHSQAGVKSDPKRKRPFFDC